MDTSPLSDPPRREPPFKDSVNYLARRPPAAGRAPAVSIIIPCYNSAALVGATLDSVLRQTFQDFEIIAVNDGSTDATLSLLRSYCDRSPERITVVDQPNSGQVASKNKALRRARGDFIAFLDSDDLWHSEKLEKQMSLFGSRPETALCYTSYQLIDRAGMPYAERRASPLFRGNCFRQLFVQNNIVGSSVMVRRSALETAGIFDEQLTACENWDLWTRIAYCFPIDFIDELLTSYRTHDANMSANVERIYRNRLQLVAINSVRYAGLVEDLPKLVQRANYLAYSSAAREHLWHLRTAAARRYIWDAIRVKPNGADLVVLLKTLLGPHVLSLARRVKADLSAGNGSPP